VKLDSDRIFIKDGRIWSSAGVTAGIDLALALIGEDLGEQVARQVAQELVVYHRRPGGQSQFSALLQMERVDGRFAGLLDYIPVNLAKRLSVARPGSLQQHESAALLTPVSGGSRRRSGQSRGTPARGSRACRPGEWAAIQPADREILWVSRHGANAP
jgi:hypothetical protein